MTIKELRQMKGMTLAAFAKSIGIGMSTYLTGMKKNTCNGEKIC